MNETAYRCPANASTGERRRIVIADDHEPTRVLMRTLIELEGMQVVGEAEDGSEAVELALEHDPDVVLLDVNMPGLDGLAAAEIIRASRPRIELLLTPVSPLSRRSAAQPSSSCLLPTSATSTSRSSFSPGRPRCVRPRNTERRTLAMTRPRRAHNRPYPWLN